MMDKSVQDMHIFGIQCLIATAIACVTQSINLEDITWTPVVARYIVYLLLIRGCELGCRLAYNTYYTYPVELHNLVHYKRHLILLGASSLYLVYWKQKLFQDELPLLFFGALIIKYFEMEASKSKNAATINYGVGMAWSFVEGYLTHIIPSDGAHLVGFEENISRFEASQGVVFPVKRLFLVITKTLYCPPDMKACNKPNREHDLPYMEALKSLEDVEKDVAGVKNRTYRNSAYKIYRPNGQLPVCVTAQFPTPLHTLHKVLQKRALYDQLVGADVPKIVEDFCATLKDTLEKSPECRGKCELIYYDDTDPEQNLADVLLAKIKEIEPKFEEIIAKKLAQMAVPNHIE